MPSVATYRCRKCATEYRPHDAGARRFICCRAELERIAPRPQSAFDLLVDSIESILDRNRKTKDISHRPPTKPARAVEIIPPRENQIDALAVEAMLQSLGAESPFSLEIAGDANSRKFLLRAESETLAYLQQQLQAVYDQASFRDVAPEQDPARSDGQVMLTAQLALQRPAYLPLRSYRNGDFITSDPVRGLLGAFAGLDEGERVLSQLVLFAAPVNWTRRYEGSARQVEQSFGGERMTMGLFIRQFVSVIGFMTTLALCLWAFFAYLQHHWLEFIVAGVLSVFALVGMGYLFMFFMEQTNVDPKLVQRKIETPAYDASLRLVATGKTREQAAARLNKLAMAYRQFSLGSGNAFVLKHVDSNPQLLSIPRFSLVEEITAHVTRLNVGELASMWHLPVGTDMQRVERTLSKRILPVPSTVAEGILVGHSVHQGERIPVHLEPESLWHHMFMVAKTQKGKSTLMAHLAAEAMKQDAAVVVIDPHGDLARSLLGYVPPSRANDVVYVDLSDPHQVIGLNLLDMSQGRSADVVVSNLVHLGEILWRDYWGPRMESALRVAAQTLLSVNEILVAQGKAQFTILDIPPLFEFGNFRHRLLTQYVKDKKITDWWSGYFERLYESLQIDVVNPVQTKIHRFSTHTTVRRIVGQSTSTVSFRKLIDERGILLVNTAAGIIGPDAGGLLGAVIVDTLNFMVRDQLAIADQTKRAKVLVVIDEFQSIPGVDYKQLLAESQKMGASFILATQSLKQLDTISPDLRSTIVSNVSTLFVFQTSAEDADFLRHELDDSVTTPDIINLDDYTTYVKGGKGHSRLPVMHVATLPSSPQDEQVIARILGGMPRYTHSTALADSEQEDFQEQWYGRERAMLMKLMMDNKLPGSPRRKNDEWRQEKRADSEHAVELTGARAPTHDENQIDETPQRDEVRGEVAPNKPGSRSNSEDDNDSPILKP